MHPNSFSFHPGRRPFLRPPNSVVFVLPTPLRGRRMTGTLRHCSHDLQAELYSRADRILNIHCELTLPCLGSPRLLLSPCPYDNPKLKGTQRPYLISPILFSSFYSSLRHSTAGIMHARGRHYIVLDRRPFSAPQSHAACKKLGSTIEKAIS